MGKFALSRKRTRDGRFGRGAAERRHFICRKFAVYFANLAVSFGDLILGLVRSSAGFYWQFTGEAMTENIFENGGEFCMRGDPEHKPVEWHWFRESTDNQPVCYIDSGRLRSCSLKGRWHSDSQEDYHDLIPIQKPPQIVPWESPDDVPDGIWVLEKNAALIGTFVGVEQTRIEPHFIFGGQSLAVGALFKFYEYHTDRRAKDGWQPCGKVAK